MIRVRRVCEITGLAVSTVYAKMAKGEFPKGAKYSSGKGGARRWSESEILEWLAEVSL
ncbi:helix-turn-helix transcriptional regulator [Granulosicoccus sp. 3-233]|uniref:helix-turn-helix transcriptional regulator n=1 Tax=Granulosicoccus sp. 3-233 TaxID=3417969 RepID=UPI003D3469BF